MKTSQLKTLIKESVKEAMDDVLKDILLEALKSNKNTITESHNIPPVNLSSTSETPSPKSRMDARNSYMAALDETMISRTSQDVSQPFIPPVNSDVINGALPEGQVGMDQIMNLMNQR